MENCLWKKVVRLNAKEKAGAIKMKQLLFVVLMTFCSVSWSKWELTGKSTDDEIIFYHDKSTIRRKGAVAKMWTMKDFSADQIGESGSYKSNKVLHAYDCLAETSTAIAFVNYSGSMGEGAVVNSVTGKESWLEWDPVVPGSAQEKMWKIACGKK